MTSNNDIRRKALTLAARRDDPLTGMPTQRRVGPWARPLPRAKGRGLAGPGQAGGRDVLVTIFLRGGIDGLTTVVPYGDAELYNLRPTIGVLPPGQTDGAVDLDGFFGLPPAAAPLMTPFSDGKLAFVHATGSTDETRSHFDAMHLMETATPQQPGYETSGWVARHLQTIAPLGSGELRGLALDQLAPRMLAEAPATLPIPDPAFFAFPGNPFTAAGREQALSNMYVKARQPYAAFGGATFGTIDLLAGVDFLGYVPSNGAVYSNDPFHQDLLRAATLIKAGVGVENIHIDLGGWDHHENQNPIGGIYAYMIDNVARGLEAFYLDLLNEWDCVTLVVQSEFGRRAAENGSLGTDHGHGNVMMLMGGHIDGGKVHTQWPGLDVGSLDLGLDLAITIDYRDILAEIVDKRLGNAANLGYVFPNYTPTYQGVVT